MPAGGGRLRRSGKVCKYRGMDARTPTSTGATPAAPISSGPSRPSDRGALDQFMARRRRGPLGSRALRPAGGGAGRRGRPGARHLRLHQGGDGLPRRRGAHGPGDLEDYGSLLEEVILYATGWASGPAGLADVHAQHVRQRFGGLERARRCPPSSPPATRETTARSVSASGKRATRRIPGTSCSSRRVRRASRRRARAATPAALEAVRTAPSATNKQPWRIVDVGGDWHFYHTAQ